MPSSLPDWLDLARAVSALEVVAFHSYQLMFLERGPRMDEDPFMRHLQLVLQSLSAHGTAAVIVFFVLSGYLVGGPAIVRARTGRLRAIDYFSARAARLYVVLIPALVVSLFAYILSRHMPSWNTFAASRQDLYDATRLLSANVELKNAVCNAAFLQTIACSEFAGNLALWSLSNEFWYYVLIFALVSVRSRPSLTILIIAIFALFVYAEKHDPTGTHVGAKFFFYFGIWCLGAAAYAVRASAAVRLGALATCLGAMWLLAVERVIPMWAASQMAIGLIATATIVGLEISRASMPRLLRPVAGYSKYSFSLYATHYPVLVLMNVAFSSSSVEISAASLLCFFLFILSCLALSVGFYWFLEVHTGSVRAFLERALGSLFARHARPHPIRPMNEKNEAVVAPKPSNAMSLSERPGSIATKA